MALSAFDDGTAEPLESEIMTILGRSGAHWRAILEAGEQQEPPLTGDWNFSGARWGWSLRLKAKKRVIVYLTPRHKHFLAGFVLGEKAVRAAEEADLPSVVLTTIREARKYAEGRGVRLEVRNRRDRDAVLQLAAIKAAN